MSIMDRPPADRREHSIGRLGYYWFLTFEHAKDFHALVKECQQAIMLPGYDLVPHDGLHLTLDRIAYDGGVMPEQIDSIRTAALSACQGQPPFEVAVEQVSNLHGAIGFRVLSAERVRCLRDTLRAATLSAYPDAPVKASASAPHVTIAYPCPNTIVNTVTAAEVDRINATVYRTSMPITEAVMVLLERRERSYSWQVIARIPLSS
ncbi:2'-5' RNA ligase family protein [Nocardia sp. NPDC004068]|uniref:2'-5' RNA ligase family protein n=1 Tax=Nocardia sp. NPDC004068 TaxID=3364303 RepID=UPI0036B7C43C